MSKVKRVLMLVNTDVTNDPRVMKEATALAAFGYQVRAIGLRSSGTEPVEEYWDRVLVRRGDTWDSRVVRNLKQRRGLKHSQSLLSEIRQSKNIGWKARLKRSTARHANQVVFIVSLFNIAVSLLWLGFHEPADVIHAHDIPSLIPGYLLSLKRRAPLIYDAHENWYDSRGGQLLAQGITRWIERTFVPRCQHVITVNESLAQRMAERISVPVPTVLLNVPQISTPTPPTPITHGQTIKLLYHGGYQSGRGLETLLQAMTLVKEPVHLTMRGFGATELQLHRLAEQLSLGDRVTFAPPVSMSALSQNASTSHIGVIPYSKRVAEFALPNKMFEYMAAGLAVVTNDLVEFRRIVYGHQIGLVCNAEDPAILAATIDDLAGDIARLNEYRLRSWQVYHGQYAWDKHKAVLLNLYGSL